jgi:hypothetical protein
VQQPIAPYLEPNMIVMVWVVIINCVLTVDLLRFLLNNNFLPTSTSLFNSKSNHYYLNQKNNMLSSCYNYLRVELMVRGFCSVCGKEVGGFLKPPAWQCPRCKKIFCADCCPKVGLVFKKPACPECGIELKR